MSEQKLVKAAKEHRCDICGTTIEKDELYHRSVYLPSESYSGGFEVFVAHRFCNLAYQDEMRDASEMEWESVLPSDALGEYIHRKYDEWGIRLEMHLIKSIEVFEHAFKTTSTPDRCLAKIEAARSELEELRSPQ